MYMFPGGYPWCILVNITWSLPRSWMSSHCHRNRGWQPNNTDTRKECFFGFCCHRVSNLSFPMCSFHLSSFSTYSMLSHVSIHFASWKESSFYQHFPVDLFHVWTYQVDPNPFDVRCTKPPQRKPLAAFARNTFDGNWPSAVKRSFWSRCQDLGQSDQRGLWGPLARIDLHGKMMENACLYFYEDNQPVNGSTHWSIDRIDRSIRSIKQASNQSINHVIF